MAQIRLNIPDEKIKKLNEFYRQEYGYDINTQLFNFINLEYDKIKDEETEPYDEPLPKADIIKNWQRSNEKWLLRVIYPDGSIQFCTDDDYEILRTLYNKWASYQFDKSVKTDLLEKIKPDYHKNIGWREGKRTVYMAERDGHKLYFGKYDTIEEALVVRDFMKKRSWDTYYLYSNLKKNNVLTNNHDYSGFMLKLARMEIE